MASREIVLLLVALVSFGSVWGTYTPKQYALLENCDDPISFSESMLLVMSNLSTVRQCHLMIQSTLATDRLLIDIIDLHFINNCSNTNLEILDEDGNSITGPICDEGSADVFKAPTNAAQFDYRTDSPNTEGKSMSIIITAFNTGYNGSCTEMEFQCFNKLCISKDLVCNSYNECSDNSDETADCHHTAASSTTSASTSKSASSSTSASTSKSASSSTSASTSKPASSSTSSSKPTPKPPKPTSTSPPVTSPQMWIVGPITALLILVKMN